jgi:steroid 5-alpha reductase family enzyme
MWGLRLASHIWGRNRKRGPDPRYVELSQKWPRRGFWVRAYGSVFMVQAGLIFLVSLNISLAATVHSPRFTLVTGLGVALWLLGFIVETMADRQLQGFIENPMNQGKIMGTGLWHYSRHPNYFGELVQWWSIGLISLGSGLVTPLIVLSPLTISILIGFVSGIPPLERRYARNAAYQAYARVTSVLIPRPPRLKP